MHLLLQIFISQQSIMHYFPFKKQVNYKCSATYTKTSWHPKKKRKETSLITSAFHHTKENKNVALNI